MATATVTLPGKGNVTVTTEPGATVADAVATAAEQLGIPAGNLDRLATVVNNADARADQPVNDGDRIAAAPRIANG